MNPLAVWLLWLGAAVWWAATVLACLMFPAQRNRTRMLVGNPIGVVALAASAAALWVVTT